MDVLFLHGGEHATPGGERSLGLGDIAREVHLPKASTFTTHYPDHTSTLDPLVRVNMVVKEYGHLLSSTEDYNEVILVGNSLGGYIASVLANRFPIRGLFLLAPALYMPSLPAQDYKPKTGVCYVIHGTQDSVVPVDGSRKFSKSVGAKLFEVNDEHRLLGSTVFLQGLFRSFCIDVREAHAADMGAV